MLNLRTLLLGLSTLGLVALFGGAHHAQATTLTNGSLIKASGPAVYYFSETGKRYAFPDQSTYATWYADFSGVQTITDSELAQLPLGGLVTVRPGARMVKIQTDPRVYAVAAGGVLRWVQTEELARALYGTDWNRLINDVPDAFFTNYRIETAVASTTDFSPSNEQSLTTTIDADIRARRTSPVPTPTPPIATSTPITPPPTTPTSTPVATTTLPFAGTLTVLTGGPYISGNQVTVSASVTRGYVDRIRLSYGTSTLLTSCTTSPCLADITLPITHATTTLPVHAVFLLGTGAGAIVTTSTQTIILLPPRTSSEITLTAPTQVSYATSRYLRAELGPTISARSIKLMLDETLLKECEGARSCSSTEIEASLPGTQHTLYAIVTDENYQAIHSNQIQFTVVQ